ncbi:translesion DNA synthesis-associated protein ImuA [Pseudomonas edaphica]|mgnify:FL=1|uniref:Translesion DNA synthesis-associated protein ImuA n=5 Tax=Pseudomonas edaphica TaxID=2006980 RepID=A0A5R8QWF4_9PSED|nr:MULTISPECIES: translesion DNA synthesis-associated protein ImuA [Pseudomonas]MCF5145162.1 translesion DNA synthesis-associated protein ImuA [Pseudomonas sp. PA-6-3C]MCF5150737.1 translesion DNA synthesis-associated protein ImuA [Pseudomonas sp. PA-6-3F]MCF5162447.1 translesion DNA synthesis-associated protein ImuA [Pseudomonas sp. PA-6-2E]MCF5178911.1 translesion DNA synthesis-associated protein ImuA [Pseudomonas sp. PA-6-1D]MCF5195832.1 translesion DNA synthesis-associated protein ImuA [Ps
MGAVVALDTLFNGGRVWKGRPAVPPASVHPTGLAALDAVLPTGGWPESALSEILMAKEGVGELQLVLPTLARLSTAGERIVLVAPPYTPYPHAWQNAGVDLRQLSVIQAEARDVLWAVEQCLRSGSCGAVLCWPRKADDRALRRLQVAAETGQTLAFAWRALSEAVNSSPAALRLAVEAKPAQVRVLKCRGGLAHPAPIALAGH